MRKVLALAAVLLVVLGVLAAVRLLVRQEETVTFERPGPVRSVVVDVDAGTVEVVGTASDGARVRRDIHWGRRRPRLVETVSDGVLRLTARCRSNVLFDCGADYRVEVPAAAAVDVRSKTGTLRVRSVSGAVKARSDAGSIDCAELRSTQVDAETDAGGVRLSFAVVPDRVSAKSDAGSIDVTVPDAEGSPRSITAETDAGSVHIRRGVAR